MDIPKVFFQNSVFTDPLKTVILKTDNAILKKRGLLRKTIYDELISYIKNELEHIKKLQFNDEWLLSRVFTTNRSKSIIASNMVGVYDRHSKTTLFLFAREISEIIYQQGFKDEIVDYFISKILLDIPKKLSRKFKIIKVEENDFKIIRK